MIRRIGLWLFMVEALLWGTGSAWAGRAETATVVDHYTVYADGAAPDHRFSPWKMGVAEIPGAGGVGRALWLNGEHEATPWAGIAFKRSRGTPFVLSASWLERGFFRFLITGGLDRYGSPNGQVSLQVKLNTENHGYQQVRARFIDRGRGLDEDPATWQEVLIPLDYWTDLHAGAVVTGLSIQTVHQVEKSFGLDDVGLVLYDRRPAWIDAGVDANVAQPWVTWPDYGDLPPTLQADRRPVRVVDGRFVGPDGRRVFLLNPYTREDPRLVYWGSTDRGDLAPTYDLYDRDRHGWLYDDLPTAATLCRLGFNSLAATMPSQPWWDAVAYPGRDRAHDPARLAAYARDVGLPYYVDFVCWPWTLGKPAGAAGQTNLSAEAFTEGANHWVPYRTIGAGRRAWLDLWTLYARRYQQAGVPVVGVELLNEPAYFDLGSEHRAAFAQWLRQRDGTVASLNRRWGTSFADFEAAAVFTTSDELKRVPGRFHDYDAYLAGTLTDLVREGVARVGRLLPEALVGVQTMGGYVLSPHDAVWKQSLVAHEGLVLTPTGGGRWTSGGAAGAPTAATTSHPIAAAPLENELLRSLAGDRMIVDNETYLRGQTARDTVRRLWEHVIVGLDGLTVFAWSKRGWAWHDGREALVTEADKYPYSCLIPLARRTEALRGIHDFARDVQALAPLILPKPWGPSARIGLLYSWSQARRRVLEPDLQDKTGAYYAALAYSHAKLAVVPADRIRSDSAALAGLAALVVGGIDTLDPEVWDRIVAFARNGGTLILAESPLSRDLYGAPLDAAAVSGVTLAAPRPWTGPLPLPETAPTWITGAVTALTVRSLSPRAADVTVLVADAAGRALVTRRAWGRGRVYTLAVDTIGYGLAKLLWSLLEDAAGGDVTDLRLARITAADGNTLAPNVLLSRRSHPDHHALLLQNRDDYTRTVTVHVDLPAGSWTVREALAGEGGPTRSGTVLGGEGLPLTLGPGDPAVVLVERTTPGRSR